MHAFAMNPAMTAGEFVASRMEDEMANGGKLL